MNNSILTDLRDEYCQQEFTLKGVNFKINKIPAVKSSLIFIGLTKKLFGNVSQAEISDNIKQNGINIISSLISSLDEDYLEDKLYPSIFKYIIIRSADNGKSSAKNINLYDSIDMLNNYNISALDVLELLIRGICVNFIDALLEKASSLKLLTKI